MRFGTLNDLTVDVKFDESVYLVYSGRDNLFFSSLACNMVNAGKRIADLNGFDSFLTKCGKHRRSCHKAECGVAGHGHRGTCKCTAYHTGDHAVSSNLYCTNCLNYTTKIIFCQEKTPHSFPSAEKNRFLDRFAKR